MDFYGGTRRKDGRGGRSDLEEGAMRRVNKWKRCKKKKKMKKWLEDASLTPAVLFFRCPPRLWTLSKTMRASKLKQTFVLFVVVFIVVVDVVVASISHIGSFAVVVASISHAGIAEVLLLLLL